MKKTVIVEILLVAVFAVLLSCAILALREIPSINRYTDYFYTLSPDYPDYDLVYVTAGAANVYKPVLLGTGIPALIAAVADLAAMVIIAVKDLPIVKQRIDSFKAKRAAVVAEKTTIAKQARIEKLQAELDELKKDE